MSATESIHVLTIHLHEEEGVVWAEVEELPGCFAAADTMADLWPALADALSLYLRRREAR